VTILINSIDIVGVWNEAWFMWITVTTDGDWRAIYTIVIASGSINGAGLIGNFVVVHPFVCINWITSVASVIFLLTGDNNLRCDVNVWPNSISLDFDSIGESGSGSMGPARSTIGRYVLVSHVGQIAFSIYVVP